MILLDPTSVFETLLDATSDPVHAERWQYYQGPQPKPYATAKLREIFAGLADSMEENLCALAINSRVHRLEVTDLSDPTAETLWDTSGFQQRQDQWFRWSLAYGATYLVAGTDRIAAVPPTMAYAAPDPDDWTGVAWAGRVWHTATEWFVRVYDDASVWQYRAPRAKGKRLDRKKLQPDPDQPPALHGFERVPFVKVAPYGPDAPILLDHLAPVQDRINKLGSNKFVAAEFGAFRQRVFLTRQKLDPHDVQNAPDMAIVLDPGDRDAPVRVQELAATDLDNYDAAKNHEVDSLFTLAALPRHLRVNPGASPSGAAITADELPFIEAVLDHQREFGESLTSLYEMYGISTVVGWRDPRAASDADQAATIRTAVDAGIPVLLAASKYGGYDEDELAALAVAQVEAMEAVGEDLRNTLR